MTPRRPAAPSDLADRGRRFWREVLKVYGLNVDELQLLAEACRTLDGCERLREQIEADGSMIKGSTGQARLHPAIAELRLQRTLLAKLLAQLGLPNVATAEPAATPAQRRARKAAEARWTRVEQKRKERSGGVGA
jgi:phage terminase small subunit